MGTIVSSDATEAYDRASVVAVVTDPHLTAEQKMARLIPAGNFVGEAAEQAVKHLTLLTEARATLAAADQGDAGTEATA